MHPSIVRPIRLMRPFWDINGAKSVIWRIRGRKHTPGHRPGAGMTDLGGAPGVGGGGAGGVSEGQTHL